MDNAEVGCTFHIFAMCLFILMYVHNILLIYMYLIECAQSDCSNSDNIGQTTPICNLHSGTCEGRLCIDDMTIGGGLYRYYVTE